YSDGYDLNLGDHVFPSVKYKLIHQKCLEEGIATADDFLQPQPAPDEDLLRVHSREWVRKLKLGKLSIQEIMRLEVPYSPQFVRACWLSCGGSTLAAQRALTDGGGFNFGGGFHHAYPDHGEGFCALNDVAVALRRLQADGAICTAMVVDLDVHHGNGTAAIFAGDATVFTLSMHQENNYPYPKPPSDLDVGLLDFTGDTDYLRLLREALDRAFHLFVTEFYPKVVPTTDSAKQSQPGRGEEFIPSAVEGHPQARPDASEKSGSGRGAQHPPEGFIPPTAEFTPSVSEGTSTTRTAQAKPDLIYYLAGADPYRQDQLGGLALTVEGLMERDRIVLDAARSRSIPIAVTFAGGYARNTADTIQIHTNTILAARETFRQSRKEPC
ncbi:MAG: histone deacetylase, partial [Candidatus Acidoferrales bacterium]